MLLPGSIVVMVLGILYQSNHSNPDVKRFLLGIAAAAVGLLSAVTLQIGRRQFRQLPDIAIIVVTFLAVSFLKIAAVRGAAWYRAVIGLAVPSARFKTARGGRASAVSSRRAPSPVSSLAN